MDAATQTKVRTYGRRNKFRGVARQTFLDSPSSLSILAQSTEIKSKSPLHEKIKDTRTENENVKISEWPLTKTARSNHGPLIDNASTSNIQPSERTRSDSGKLSLRRNQNKLEKEGENQCLQVAAKRSSPRRRTGVTSPVFDPPLKPTGLELRLLKPTSGKDDHQSTSLGSRSKITAPSATLIGSARKRTTCNVAPTSSPQRTGSLRKRTEPSTPQSATYDDDLSTAFADLSLASIHDPQHQRPFRSPIEASKICQRPALVTKATEAYVQPLIECKNVSKCIEDFQAWMDERNGLLDVAKIGEGSFGEVYRAQGGKDVVILKLMPLNAQKGKGSRSFTSVCSAKNEVRLLSRMSKVPGFVEFRGACILQGRMPQQMIHQWNQYAVSGRTVESKDPSKKDSYASTQLWLLIEMSDAGESLERGRYQPPEARFHITSKSKEPYLPLQLTWDVFWQIVKALAKGEVFAGYEHRDLHLGNICIKAKSDNDMSRCSESTLSVGGTEAHGEEPMRVYGINKSRIEATLIDYSLSRASLGPGETLAYDFKNDKALLRGKGDLQYDMYRHMAAVVGKQASSDFVPRTNVMWLYYVLHLLLEASLPSTSVYEAEMSDILQELKLELQPEKMHDWGWESAGDLIEMGLESNWFLPEHVIDI